MSTRRNGGSRTRSGLPAVAPKTFRHDETDIAERRAKVFELRKMGRPFRAIAAEVGVTVATVHDDWRQALDDLLPVEDVEEVRRAELDRLDHLMVVAMERLAASTLTVEELMRPGVPAALLGVDVDKAILTVLRIQERRARLAGLDMPTEATVEHRVTIAVPQQVTTLRDDLAERRARTS